MGDIVIGLKNKIAKWGLGKIVMARYFKLFPDKDDDKREEGRYMSTKICMAGNQEVTKKYIFRVNMRKQGSKENISEDIIDAFLLFKEDMAEGCGGNRKSG